MTTRFAFILFAVFAIATVTTVTAGHANEDDGVLDEKPIKKPEAKAPKKKTVKPAPKTDAKKAWARDYERARSRRIRDLQAKLAQSFIDHDLEDMVFDKTSRKGDPPAKRYKPLYEFLDEYRALEDAAKTQQQKLDLQKLWSQLTKYSKARVYKKGAIIAKGLQKAFNVQDAEKRVEAAKDKAVETRKENPKAAAKIFLAENAMKRENQEFKKARRGLPKPMRAAFPGID